MSLGSCRRSEEISATLPALHARKIALICAPRSLCDFPGGLSPDEELVFVDSRERFLRGFCTATGNMFGSGRGTNSIGGIETLAPGDSLQIALNCAFRSLEGNANTALRASELKFVILLIGWVFNRSAILGRGFFCSALSTASSLRLAPNDKSV